MNGECWEEGKKPNQNKPHKYVEEIIIVKIILYVFNTMLIP